jgi:Domain of unknown function (DUF4476)
MQKPGLFGMNGFIIFLLTCLSVVARGQQPGYMILIDAENKQAFTVRIGDQLFSSSGHGHLVLSQLKDSSYLLNLRFPKNNRADQVFPVVVRKKDLGFQLKGADSSWVLYNWQTKETIRPVTERDSSRILDMGVKRENGFSKLMASVVNDSSVMYNTYKGNSFNRDSSKTDSLLTVNRQPPTANLNGHRPSKDSLATAKKAATLKDSLLTANRQPPTANLNSHRPSNDSLLTANHQPPTANLNGHRLSKDSLLTANRQPPTANLNGHRPSKDSLLTANRQPPTANPSSTPGVKKLREVSLKISRKIVFLDTGKDGLVDTITLFVYFESADTAIKKTTAEPVLAVKKPTKTDSTNLSVVAGKNKTNLKPNESACGQLATDQDVAFLRSAILKANTDQDKISVASGAFALKCFSVSQIRLLAGLLVSDKSKYRLMDAAHLHVADYEHFRELVDMLTDKNFQRKFLAMAEKRS